MVKITFYYKPGCWICDSAEEMLNGQKEKYNIKITKVDITSSDEFYETYRFDIPVFEFKDGSTLHGTIKRRAFFRKLEENRE